MSRIVVHMKGARRASICPSRRAISASVLSIRPNRCANWNWRWSARCRLNAQPNAFTVCFTWIGGTPKVRIHGRPRSDRKRRFLLSVVAPSTSTRHPREARPINWAQRGGLASGGENCLLTPRPHSTAHHARLVTRWLLLRTALLFVRSAVRLVYAERIARVGTPKEGDVAAERDPD